MVLRCQVLAWQKIKEATARITILKNLKELPWIFVYICLKRGIVYTCGGLILIFGKSNTVM